VRLIEVLEDEKTVYVFVCRKEDRHPAKDAGFKWDGRRWWTPDPFRAAKLKEYTNDPKLMDFLAGATHGQLHFDGSRFNWISAPEFAGPARDSRFRWDRRKRQWWTEDPVKAQGLIHHADDETRAYLEGRERERAATLEASRATTADLEIPIPDALLERGMNYLPFQRAGIAFGARIFSAHNPGIKGVLIGDEMGLGKTIQAIGLMNLFAFKKILVICPASLKLNWYREISRWLVHERSMIIAEGQTKAWMMQEAQIVIINYDVLRTHMKLVSEIVGRSRRKKWSISSFGALDQPWDFIITDECHYLRNRTKAQRAVAGLALLERAEFSAALSGTPMVNRPLEMFGILHALAPGIFAGVSDFQERFCDAHFSDRGFDVKGASQLDKLQELLRSTVMVRRLKKDVLLELPPKVRQVIEVQAGTAEARQALAAEAEAWGVREDRLVFLKASVELAKAAEDAGEYKRALGRLGKSSFVAFTEMSIVRHRVGLAKVPFVIEHMEGILDDNPGYKLIVFAHHTDVIEKIAAAFGRRAVTVTGSVSSDQKVVAGKKTSERQIRVDAFQEDPEITVIIGEYGPLGTGWTLTASSHVIIAEEAWVPLEVTQAEDRAHRYGQRDSVLVQHMVLEGSLDVKMVRAMVDKQDVADAALDRIGGDAAEPIVPLDEGATYRISRAELDAVGEQLLMGHLAAVTEFLRLSPGLELPKVDARICAELKLADSLSRRQAALTQRLAWAFRRLLPEELVAALEV
jgi:SWI/SNF-related matrix-associated actin-dependent regulator 1 of chromatin subfamily A